MPESVNADLLPMTIGDLVDESFDLYKRNFALFAGIVAVVQVPAQILWSWLDLSMDLNKLINESFATGTVSGDARVALRVVAIVLGALGASILVFMVQSGALTAAISERVLGGRTTIWGAYRAALPRWLTLIVTWLEIGTLVACVSLGVMLVFGVFLASVAAAGGETSTPDNAAVATVVVLAAIATFVVASFLVAAVAAFLTQVIVVEKIGSIGAINRNWQLVRGRTAQTWVSLVLLAVIVAIVTFSVLFTTFEGFVYLTSQSLHLTRFWENILGDAFAGVASLLVQPLFTVFLTLLYYDRRVRREGFDVAVLERQIHAARSKAVAP